MIQARQVLAEAIARELGVSVLEVSPVIEWFDKGATVPFMAAYRKEVTAGFTTIQLRLIQRRLQAWYALAARRQVIIQQLTELNQATPALLQSLHTALTQVELEDCYAPYRPKRRSKALAASEAGLSALVEQLLQQPHASPEQLAQSFIGSGIQDVRQALDGARHILFERFAASVDLMRQLRTLFWEQGILKAEAVPGKKAVATQFSEYAHYVEPIKSVSSQRALVLFRARREQAIQLQVTLPDVGEVIQAIQMAFQLANPSAWLMETVKLTWKNRLLRTLEAESLARLRELADEEAIRLLSRDLRAALWTPPIGQVVTIGIEPGFRAGIKMAVVDAGGHYLDHATVFPFAPDNAREQSIIVLAKLMAKYHVQYIGIGNGTGSREATQLVTECIKRYPDMPVRVMPVPAAGVAVYATSALAATELAQVEVSVRGAVSIARRLHDPLAELVKLEPQSIVAGPYQHAVNPACLASRLHEVVEDCVNAIGVDINTASAELLRYIAGFNPVLAREVVLHRVAHGAFVDRQQLHQVNGMCEKIIQQAAGFLRIVPPKYPLDNSAVHPEAYPLVERILADNAWSLTELLANPARLNALDAARYVDEQFGLPSVLNVLAQLQKCGRDSRIEVKSPCFKAGVDAIQHLRLGMLLEGVVSHVTDFGAFVDIGVHQDGLVHISAMHDRFVRDPYQWVKAGDIVQVKVIEVDCKRRRIGLSMRLGQLVADQVARKPAQRVPTVQAKKPATPKPNKYASPAASHAPFNTAMADAFARLKRG